MARSAAHRAGDYKEPVKSYLDAFVAQIYVVAGILAGLLFGSIGFGKSILHRAVSEVQGGAEKAKKKY